MSKEKEAQIESLTELLRKVVFQDRQSYQLAKIIIDAGYRLPPAGDLREAEMTKIIDEAAFQMCISGHYLTEDEIKEQREYWANRPEHEIKSHYKKLAEIALNTVLSLFPHHELKASEKPNFCCSQCGGYNWNETPRGKFHCQICGHWVNADGSTYTVAQCAADKKKGEG